MKLAILVTAFLAFTSASSLSNLKGFGGFVDEGFLEKQKFLFEIVYRVQEPLMFEEWIKLGGVLITDKSHYVTYNHLNDQFHNSWKIGTLLPRGEHFGSATRFHMLQFRGLFNFLYYAKDWETVVHNVCWARLHVNEGMFIHALTLAVIHRKDMSGLILPSIYEIFPHHFFNNKLIFEAIKFDYKTWNKQIMYEGAFEYIKRANVTTPRQTHLWQWWKQKGLEKQFYSEEKFIHRENIENFISNDFYCNQMMKDVQKIWTPVDYTRDVEIFNDHSKLSYFFEDVGWNSYWYYLNYDYPYFLQAERFSLGKDRQAEWWLWNVQQILARYYMERLSHGFGDIDELSWEQSVDVGYNPQLISYNGVGFSYRKNYWEVNSIGNVGMLNKLKDAYRRIYEVIDLGYLVLSNGTKIDLRHPESIEIIGNLIKGRVDNLDYKYFSYWITVSSMYVSGVDYNDRTIVPTSFTNFETMLRDPLFYEMYKIVANIYQRFKYHLRPYTKTELLFDGVTINDVRVDKLVTFFDLVDFDITNLLNYKMAFVDGQFQWNKMLMARQMRLNHRPFNFEISITSSKDQNVIVRTFIGPKYDEFGRNLNLADNRVNFMELDEFVSELVQGKNLIKRNSNKFAWTVKDRATYTEFYRYLMLSENSIPGFPLVMSQPHCGFPDRLILPRGWHQGMPMQMFVMVTPFITDYEQFATYDPNYSCGIGSGVRHIDNMTFGYPFDRILDDNEFFVPNMYMKDVYIYHE